MSHFVENADTDADEKVSHFASHLLYTVSSSLTMIKEVSFKIKNKEIDNSNLYLIIFACDKFYFFIVCKYYFYCSV